MASMLSRLIFAGTIFLSAALLFLVQPLIAKQILPWFGGSAAVWSICMVFFQVLLLAGYAYSDWVSRHLAPRTQAMLHTALLAASLTFLPIVAAAHWKPGGNEDPTWWILGLLGATIGLPYFLLSTTGPLVQSWVARTMLSAQVYRYFSLSNLASLLALVSYPFVIEPHARLLVQAQAWSVGYAAFAVLCVASAWYFARHAQALPAAVSQQAGADAAAPQPARREYFVWLALSALGSWLLVAITNHITQNVAAIPFLWLLPLTIYLFTFVLCFESDRWYRRRLWLAPAAAMLLLCAYGLQDSLVGLNIRVAIPVYALGLFVLCMFLHGELAQRRPTARYLTRYYLMLSLGGAIGGIAVGLIAPRVLPAYYELGIGLVLTALLAALVLGARRSLRFGALGAAAACAVFLGLQVQDDVAGTRHMERNFYGTLLTADVSRENPRDNVRQLYHGSVKHGEQYLAAERRQEPTTYYGPTSGVGLAIAQAQAAAPVNRVGLIGLGAGVLAAYGRAGDNYRFYEINPAVLTVAQSEFSFMRDSRAHIDTVLGDARLALEREPPQRFHVLAVDAFSGDSVPVHLITVEALRIYLRHLHDDGIVAFHLTNRFLALPPVVQRLAEEVGAASLLVHDAAENSDLRATDWVLVAKNPAVLQTPALRRAALAVANTAAPARGVSTWTDDFNNLFEVLK
jgi:spermidine synthase